ncbi:MAG: DUF4250 domain-containing protein [Clostridium sp.]
MLGINDPNILLSMINMKLRDKYDSLEDLCYDLDISEIELKEKLKVIGYEYSMEENAFK